MPGIEPRSSRAAMGGFLHGLELPEHPF